MKPTSIIERLEAIGGEVGVDGAGDVRSLRLSDCRIDQETWEEIVALRTLVELSVEGLGDGEDEGPGRRAFGGIGGLTGLERLALVEMDLDMSDLAPLGALRGLQELSIIDCGPISDESMHVLGDLPDLRLLSLSCTPDPNAPTTGVGLGRLGHGPLETLRFQSAHLRSETLGWLASCPGLRVLSLAGNALRAADLAFLGGCDRLRVLDLAGCRFDGPLGQVLGTLTRIEVLRLGRIGAARRDPASERVGRPLWSTGGRAPPSWFAELLPALRAAGRLETLDLSHWPLDDASIDGLAALEAGELVLVGSRITPAGLARLKDAFRGAVRVGRGDERFSLTEAHRRRQTL